MGLYMKSQYNSHPTPPQICHRPYFLIHLVVVEKYNFDKYMSFPRSLHSDLYTKVLKICIKGVPAKYKTLYRSRIFVIVYYYRPNYSSWAIPGYIIDNLDKTVRRQYFWFQFYTHRLIPCTREYFESRTAQRCSLGIRVTNIFQNRTASYIYYIYTISSILKQPGTSKPKYFAFLLCVWLPLNFTATRGLNIVFGSTTF